MNTTNEPIHLGNSSRVIHNSFPEAAIPSRASLTVNCLLPIRKKEDVFLLYHNFDPKNWNEWYPPFTFYHTEIQIKSNHSESLVSFMEHNSEISEHYNYDRLAYDLGSHVAQLIHAENAEIDVNPVSGFDYWLKFSKSRNVWTLYCFAFMLCTDVTPLSSLYSLKNQDIDLISISENRHRGISVVENTVELLSQPEIVKVLNRNALVI